MQAETELTRLREEAAAREAGRPAEHGRHSGRSPGRGEPAKASAAVERVGFGRLQRRACAKPEGHGCGASRSPACVSQPAGECLPGPAERSGAKLA